MRNFLTTSPTTSVRELGADTSGTDTGSDGPADTDAARIDVADTGSTRVQNRLRSRMRRRLIVAGSLVAASAMVGSGFAVQSTVAATNERVAATAALTASTGLQSEQLGVYAGIVEARAHQKAEGTLSGANIVLAAAQGKADTTALEASVASLGNYTLLAPDRVFELVEKTTVETASVQAATAEVDRVAAEQAAAAAAAAAKAAAVKAAEEAAAAKAAQASAAAKAPAVAAPSRPSAPTDPTGAQAIARDMMLSQYGWGDDQFGCLVPLWQRESGWNVNAYNASSGATGIPQALPGNKMASAGADWQTNPATQISWGLSYISGRYGTPCAAWDHSESAGWY